jgi:hypothetical protein
MLEEGGSGRFRSTPCGRTRLLQRERSDRDCEPTGAPMPWTLCRRSAESMPECIAANSVNRRRTQRERERDVEEAQTMVEYQREGVDCNGKKGESAVGSRQAGTVRGKGEGSVARGEEAERERGLQEGARIDCSIP